MRRELLAIASVCLLTAVCAASAHEMNLPPGPIKDRHELMEGIGKSAKAIGDAMKAGDLTPVPAAADKIHQSAEKVTSLFPPGSTDPKSRAKPEIWEHWSDFEAGVKKLQDTSATLAQTARSGGDVPQAAKAMFGTCKSCHEQFRVPDKDEK